MVRARTTLLIRVRLLTPKVTSGPTKILLLTLGNGLGEHGLAGARRPVEQEALGRGQQTPRQVEEVRATQGQHRQLIDLHGVVGALG